MRLVVAGLLSFAKEEQLDLFFALLTERYEKILQGIRFASMEKS